MKSVFDAFLPSDLLRRASTRGLEYAWRLRDIPSVIEASRRAGLINIGGQLQFRLPSGETCECYWIAVDTSKDVDRALPWAERVERTAEAARQKFALLPSEDALMKEGVMGFGKRLTKATADGRGPADIMCFVWQVAAQDGGG